MVGTKIYLQPKVTLLNAISDLIELQKGKVAHSDTPNGQITFSIRLYHQKRELQFTVEDIANSRCRVRLEIKGETQNAESFIQREFALLDSMMVTLAQIELAEKDETNLENQIQKGTSKPKIVIFALLIALAMALILAACVRSGENKSSPADSGTQTDNVIAKLLMILP